MEAFNTLRERANELERVLARLRVALLKIKEACPYDGSFQGGGISEFDDWTSGHRHISATCHRIAHEALKSNC